METEDQRDDEQQAADESVEDFKRDMEQDPSRAPADDEELERRRGG